jgi:LPS-assembly protein
MLPAPQSLLQAPRACLHPLAGLMLKGLAIAVLIAAQPFRASAALAQDSASVVQPEAVQPETAQGDMAPEDAAVAFEADRVEYHETGTKVIASGNVVLRRGDQSARADTVTWYQDSARIEASGNVRVVDENGNQLYTDRVELTEELKAGAMENLLIAMREGGRLAAVRGTRMDNGEIVLDRAAYTGCAVEDSKGCPKKPSWRVTARQVIHDPAAKRIHFKGARLEIFSLPLVPLPGLSIRSDGSAVSGLLVPDFASTPSNGLEVAASYYLRLAENRDLTLGSHVYTKAPPMLSGQYRALGSKGAYQITGYATESRRIGVGGAGMDSQRSLRGYVFANGRFQFTPEWSVTASIRRASDRTFLRRYDISRDDRLRSMIEVERITTDSYLSLAGWETQTLRVGDREGLVPLALPVLDYRRRINDPLFGGRIELQANSMAIERSSGQDTQRAFAGARWDLRRITGMGQEVTLTTLVRGDVYHSDGNDLTPTAIYRGKPGWQTRGVATAALDVKWPFSGQFMGGTQVLTPRFQIVASPSIRNLGVPNEDARSIDLEDSNLFALNRFPGYDRIEDGVRFTYGFDWQFERPRWRVKSTLGQSFRLTREPTLLPNGTGLSSRTSDIVGRTEIRYRDFIKLTHRFRLDKDSQSFRRNEFDATIGSHRTYAEVGYVRLNRNIAAGLEDLQDREELRASVRVAFARYWSVFGSGVFNLTDRKEDPLNNSDGFQPLRTRLGLAYQDDCLDLAVTWRRDYQSTGDARRGNTFQVLFNLRNLGFR